MSPRSSFYVDGQPITIPGVRWVTDQQKLHGPQNVSMAQVTLPGRDGELAIPSTRTIGAATWSLSVSIQGEDYADFMANKAALERLLSPAKRLITIREDVKGWAGLTALSLSAEAYLTGSDVSGPWDAAEDGADVTYHFRIPSGVWEEEAISSSYSTSGTHTFADARGGSAPQYGVGITLMTSGAVDFKISNVDTGDSYLAFTDPDNPGGRITDIDAATVSSTYRSSPLPIRNSNAISTGESVFYIPTDGRFRIDKMQGVTSATITTRKAHY